MIKYDRSVLTSCIPLRCTTFVRENAFSMFKLEPVKPTTDEGHRDIAALVNNALLREHQLHLENGKYPVFMYTYLLTRYSIQDATVNTDAIAQVMSLFEAELDTDANIEVYVTVYPSMVGCQFDIALSIDGVGTRFSDPDTYSYTDLVTSTDGDMRDNYWLRIDTLAKYQQLEGTVFLLNREMANYFERQ